MNALPYACSWCMDRGWYSYFRGGTQFSLGEVFTNECQHCRGNKSTNVRGLDRDLRDAIDWFKESQPPPSAFRLSKFKYIDSPTAYWKELRSEISLDNIYRLEYIREDLIALRDIFSGDDL